jgi:hypothetical protein
MHSAVERHDFLDRSWTEIDAVVLFQKKLYPKPTGIAVFLLQFEYRMNRTEVDLSGRSVWFA